MSVIDRLLHFWFGPPHARDRLPDASTRFWWEKNDATDSYLRWEFGEHVTRALQGAYDHWTATAHGRLALVLLLDQITRNVHRERPEMYAGDAKALALALEGLEQGDDRMLRPIERWFLYMPLMHAEDVHMQRRCVELFDRLLDEAPPARRDAFASGKSFAVQHARIVERFGRFPHRNAVLGRQSTQEELRFLEEPGSSF